MRTTLDIDDDGLLATFDRTIPVNAVRGAGPDTLQVIAPVEAA